MTNKECKKLSPFQPTSRVICAVNPGTQLWNGDSGGPLTVVDKRKHFLVGVASYALCTSTVPTGFARVSSVGEWIEERLRGITCI